LTRMTPLFLKGEDEEVMEVVENMVAGDGLIGKLSWENGRVIWESRSALLRLLLLLLLELYEMLQGKEDMMMMSIYIINNIYNKIK
jgi:hypothetical protein